ncbi:MAG: exo-alpha-sialidase [bacterium]|nr:exo-alpha-sialidase [bacterium]
MHWPTILTATVVLTTICTVCASAEPPARNYTIRTIDLTQETQRQVVIDREPGQYLGHPTTVLLEDNKTMLIVYPKGHGRGAIVMKRSTDTGLTWSDRLPVPENWATSKEVPTIYRVVDREGVKRLIMFSGLYPNRMAFSEDDGQTWSPLEPIHDFGGIVSMGDLVRLKDGRYMAFFHDDGRFYKGKMKKGPFFVYKTVSDDGGLTWSDPEIVVQHPKAHLCEPGVVRSPDGNQLAMLLRENSRKFNGFVTYSNDEGATWSDPVELPASLTGDRHKGRYAPDGRLVFVFRDTTHVSPTKGDFVAWVGTYDDIVAGREGQYRVRLLDNTKGGDCGYPGLELLPDGTFIATTYGHWTKGEEPYIMSSRFKLSELDDRASAAPKVSVPFVSGDDGYHTFRIPATIVTQAGTVLAFAEGRASRSDHAQNDIVLKRSTDGGRHWGPIQLVAEDGGNCLNNPLAVVVRETGRILFMYQRYPEGHHEMAVKPGHEGPLICRGFITVSDDDGLTWTTPKDITSMVKRPTGATSIAGGPGIGIQLRRGPHKGRILVPFNEGPKTEFRVYAVYSDDLGETWAYGDLVPEAPKGHGNELQFVELVDGSILLNSRSRGGDKRRLTAISKDGGITWSPLENDPTLVEPECMGSIIRYSDPLDGKRSRLAYAGPNSQSERENGTVWLSYDEGKTWPVSKTIQPWPYAYSCLTVLPDGMIGCLYETGFNESYERIDFARIPLEWLTDGADSGEGK